jgi:hypothetical protein
MFGSRESVGRSEGTTNAIPPLVNIRVENSWLHMVLMWMRLSYDSLECDSSYKLPIEIVWAAALKII